MPSVWVCRDYCDMWLRVKGEDRWPMWSEKGGGPTKMDEGRYASLCIFNALNTLSYAENASRVSKFLWSRPTFPWLRWYCRDTVFRGQLCRSSPFSPYGSGDRYRGMWMDLLLSTAETFLSTGRRLNSVSVAETASAIAANTVAQTQITISKAQTKSLRWRIIDVLAGVKSGGGGRIGKRRRIS